MTDELPSVGVLLAAVERHLDQQQRHFESLDAKAGVAVGFAGVIAAIGGDVEVLAAKAGVGFAVVAAVLAVLSFRPRKQPVFDPRRLRHYLRADDGFTQLKLLDTEIKMALQASRLIEVKARFLQASLAVLVISVALLAGATVAA